MSTKQRLLSLLEKQGNQFVSGEEIAAQLELSRAAVWKAANALRKDGFAIEAAQNRGYRLNRAADVLSCEGIYPLLEVPGLRIQLLPSVTSTNAALKEIAETGASEGEVIIAAEQTAGRGRMGRGFFSPRDTGLYMSVLLRPQGLEPTHAPKITTMAAVAACEAIEELISATTQIKWVNDIYLRGRKVGGILTEASIHLETGALDSVILGIGINLYPPVSNFPDELSDIAGAVLDIPQADGRNRLAASFLNHFFALYNHRDAQEVYAEKYRSRSLVIGRSILVVSGSQKQRAVALDIDKDCRLIVRYNDGHIGALSSAEVHILPCTDE